MTRVLFVCVKNGGKSRMAAGPMADTPGVTVSSAGTRPGTALNGQSVQALAEVGIDISAESPRPITAELVAGADLVVALGREAQVDAVPGTRIETWETDEPSERGIEAWSACGWSATTSPPASATSPHGSALDTERERGRITPRSRSALIQRAIGLPARSRSRPARW